MTARREQHPTAQRIVRAISLLALIALTAGVLIVELRQGSTSPGISMSAVYDGAYERDGVWYLPVEVENSGDITIDRLRVTAVRPIAGEAPEEAELEFDFVSGGETVTGWAAFDEEPTAGSIELDEVSYTVP
jgi:uncharacterized protein (TIGR02588 family)